MELPFQKGTPSNELLSGVNFQDSQVENQPFVSPNEKDVFLNKGTLEEEGRYFLRSRKQGFEGFFGKVSSELGKNVEKYKIGKGRKYILQLDQENVVGM